MHKSSKTRWGVWSDWIWNEEHRRYYRQRQDTNGNIDTEWDPRGSTPAAAANDDETPRDPDYESLAQTLQDTHLQSPSTTSYDHHSSEYTFESGSSRHKSKSSSKGKSRATKSSSSRSKGKAPAVHDDDFDHFDPERDPPHGSSSRQPASDEQPQHYYDPATQQYYQYPQVSQQPDVADKDAQAGEDSLHGSSSYQFDIEGQPRHYLDPATGQYYEYPQTSGGQPASTYPDTASATRPTAGQYAEDYGEEEDPVAAAIAESRRYNYGASTPGEASGSTYSEYDYEDEGVRTPRAGGSDAHISATGGQAEELDPRYRVEPSHRFQPGEIFKVLWCEPQGSANEGAPSISERFEVRDRFGGRIFVGFRRFIVIANDQGHCTCVPILTYGGKACNKRGVKPDKHGIVYEKGHKARLLSGEPKLGFAPVKIQMLQDGEKLSRESRVNYSKLVTVEHNVKVLFIGRIVPADWDIVSEAVNRCWEEKIHHTRRHFDR